MSSASRQEVRAGRAPHDTQHLSSVSRTGAKVEEKKAKGKGEMEKGREQQKKHAGFQFPKSLMTASTSHECCGLGARRMQNGNQTERVEKAKSEGEKKRNLVGYQKSRKSKRAGKVGSRGARKARVQADQKE